MGIGWQRAAPKKPLLRTGCFEKGCLAYERGKKLFDRPAGTESMKVVPGTRTSMTNGGKERTECIKAGLLRKRAMKEVTRAHGGEPGNQREAQ